VQYDIGHGFWKAALPFRFEDLVQRAIGSDLVYADTLGYRLEPTLGWGGAATVPENSEWGLDDTAYQANMKRHGGLREALIRSEDPPGAGELSDQSRL